MTRQYKECSIKNSMELLEFALQMTRIDSLDPAEMPLKRMLEALRLIKSIESNLTTEIIKEAIKEGFTGWVFFDPGLEDLLENYS